MKCLILAAGRGSRLSENKKVDCKPLFSLKGEPLLSRTIATAALAGARDFFVVTGFKHSRLETFLEDYSSDCCFPIHPLYNPEWSTGNGMSVLAAKAVLTEPFILLMSDHLFDAEILRGLIAAGVGKDGICLAVDRRVDGNPLVELSDVTKVRTENDRILDIGKTISEFNAFDTGIFLATPALFEAMEESVDAGDFNLSGGVRNLARQGKAFCWDIGDRFWMDIDTPEDVRRAEEYL